MSKKKSEALKQKTKAISLYKPKNKESKFKLKSKGVNSTVKSSLSINSGDETGTGVQCKSRDLETLF